MSDEMRISDWSSELCSSVLRPAGLLEEGRRTGLSVLRNARGVRRAGCRLLLQYHPVGRGGLRDRFGQPGYLHAVGYRGLLPPEAWLGRVEGARSEEHTSELQSLMRISYAVFCLKKKTSRVKNYNRHIR